MMPWLKLHRAVVDHSIFQDAERFRAWVWLLARVADTQTTSVVSGCAVTLMPGSMATTQSEMAAALFWTRGRVRAFLAYLVDEGMAVVARVGEGVRAAGILVAVVNWEQYQGRQQPVEQPVTQPVRTSTRARRSRVQQPVEQPVRARESLFQEEREIAIEEEGAGEPRSMPDDDLASFRAPDSYRPSVSRDRGELHVSFHRPPPAKVKQLLRRMGFAFIVEDPADLSDRRRQPRRYWAACNTPESREVVRVVTGITVPDDAQRAAAAPRPVRPVAGVESPASTAIRGHLRRALGEPEYAASFGLVALTVDGGVVSVTAADELTALLVEKKYRRVLERCAAATSEAPARVLFGHVEASGARL